MDDLKSEVPELHQHAPILGEQYDDAYRRLQNYAIVIGSGSEKKGRVEYLCVYHGGSRNTRHISNLLNWLFFHSD